MVQRFYRADYVDKSGKVLASYSFQADTNVKAMTEARRHKRTLGCEICLECKPRLYLTGKVYPEKSPPKKRGPKPKGGIEWNLRW